MSGPISFGTLFSVNIYCPMIPLQSVTMFCFRLPACRLQTIIVETLWDCASLLFVPIICSAGKVSPDNVVYSLRTLLLDLLSGKHISPDHLSFPALHVLYSFREAECSVYSCSFRHFYDRFVSFCFKYYCFIAS